MAKVEISLPDQLAEEARRAGLLSSPRLEEWLREQIRTQRVDELFTAMDRMAAVSDPAPMSPEEVTREIPRCGLSAAPKPHADAVGAGYQCCYRRFLVGWYSKVAAQDVARKTSRSVHQRSARGRVNQRPRTAKIRNEDCSFRVDDRQYRGPLCGVGENGKAGAHKANRGRSG